MTTAAADPSTANATSRSGGDKRLARAKRHEERILRRIAHHEAAGRHRQARHAQRMLLRSYDAAAAALSEANRRRDRNHRLAAGQILQEAATLNPWREEVELVPVTPVPKPKGGFRPLIAPRLRRKALSFLAAKAMRAFVAPEPRLYSATGKGRSAAAQAVRDALADGYAWAVSVDVRDFYGSLDHDRLRELLPLPQAVTDRTVLPHQWHLDFNSIWERSEHEIDQLVTTIRRQIEPDSPYLTPYDPEGMVLLAWAGRGIPQGAPASALVAEIVAAEIARRLPADARVFVYMKRAGQSRARWSTGRPGWCARHLQGVQHSTWPPLGCG